MTTDTSAALRRCSPETGRSTHFEQPAAKTVAPGGGGSLVAAVPVVLRSEAGREPRGSASRTLLKEPGQRRIPLPSWSSTARSCHFEPQIDASFWHESGTTGAGEKWQLLLGRPPPGHRTELGRQLGGDGRQVPFFGVRRTPGGLRAGRGPRRGGGGYPPSRHFGFTDRQSRAPHAHGVRRRTERSRAIRPRCRVAPAFLRQCQLAPKGLRHPAGTTGRRRRGRRGRGPWRPPR
jgi:hypothetical protein